MYPNILKLNSVTITNSKLSIMKKLYVIRSKMLNHLKSSYNINTQQQKTHKLFHCFRRNLDMKECIRSRPNNETTVYATRLYCILINNTKR